MFYTFSIRTITLKISVATIIAVLLLLIPARIVYSRVDAATETPPVVKQEPDALTVWLDDLAWYESTGDDGAKVLDTNGRYSYGCLQFQMATFVSEAKKFGIDIGDASVSVMDCSLQKRIARQMLEHEKGAWRNWYTSIAVRGLRMPPIIQ